MYMLWCSREVSKPFHSVTTFYQKAERKLHVFFGCENHIKMARVCVKSIELWYNIKYQSFHVGLWDQSKGVQYLRGNVLHLSFGILILSWKAKLMFPEVCFASVTFVFIHVRGWPNENTASKHICQISFLAKWICLSFQVLWLWGNFKDQKWTQRNKQNYRHIMEP